MDGDVLRELLLFGALLQLEGGSGKAQQVVQVVGVQIRLEPEDVARLYIVGLLIGSGIDKLFQPLLCLVTGDFQPRLRWSFALVRYVGVLSPPLFPCFTLQAAVRTPPSCARESGDCAAKEIEKRAPKKLVFSPYCIWHTFR